MDANIKNPIEILTETLAVMTERAVEAERQRDEAINSSNEWFAFYPKKDEELGREMEAHAATKRKLEQLSDRLKPSQVISNPTDPGNQ